MNIISGGWTPKSHQCNVQPQIRCQNFSFSPTGRSAYILYTVCKNKKHLAQKRHNPAGVLIEQRWTTTENKLFGMKGHLFTSMDKTTDMLLIACCLEVLSSLKLRCFWDVQRSHSVRFLQGNSSKTHLQMQTQERGFLSFGTNSLQRRLKQNDESLEIPRVPALRYVEF